jgi:hypothetical protein
MTGRYASSLSLARERKYIDTETLESRERAAGSEGQARMD